ncbi:MAG: hypothetical protein HFJ10_08000, partial [Lachnospiraceae bacterium]|nr:hypothetical protein [Lachnospiraceae bacterium]
MNDKGLQILEQYDIRLLRSFGGRGAVMLETEQGLKLLKQFAGSKTKLPYEQCLLARLEEEKVCHTDQAVPNRQGELVSVGDYETPYLLKDWPSGKECDTKSEEDLLKSMRTLGCIHRVARDVWKVSGKEHNRLLGTDRREEFEKHNRELKRVQNFVRAKHKKCNFELLYLKYAEKFMKEGQYALERLQESAYASLYQKAWQQE